MRLMRESERTFLKFSTSLFVELLWRWIVSLKTKASILFLCLSVFIFNISHAEPPATLNSPSNNSLNVSDDTQNFNWSTVNGANTYRIVVSNSSSFSNFVDDGGNSYCVGDNYRLC